VIDLKTIQAHVGVAADGILGPATLKAIGKALGISEQVHTMGDPAAFFAAVRKITGPLNSTQVETINGLLASAAHWPVGWLAYGLATAWHEARLMPVEEIGKGKGRPYGIPGKYGQAQYGRGLVQLTWDTNYEWADKAVAEAGLLPRGAILADFSLVMRPDIAAFILVKGMEDGAFTGKSLGDYVGQRGTVAEFTEARRIINGTDRAAMIAGYAVQFQDAAVSGGWA
jgi:putative chitinase